MTDKPFFTRLKNRGCLKISGADRKPFLQGLVTNDINALDTNSCVYACLLNPQGKFLYDFFITQDSDTLILDCEGGARAYDLAKLLMLYKLRADLQIIVEPEISVFAVFGGTYGAPDPRHKDMGYRSFEKPDALTEMPFEVWDEHRLRLCVPDGSRDMVVGQSTMLESRIDTLNGLSFDKGCYMGQELTARTHYRGLIKKHLYAIKADSLPDSGTEIKIDGRIVGEMRSSCERIGLAFLKDEAVDEIQKSGFRLLS